MYLSRQSANLRAERNARTGFWKRRSANKIVFFTIVRYLRVNFKKNHLEIHVVV